MRGPAAVWIARRLPVDDDAHREEIAGSVAHLVAARPRCERAREAASLVGLWLRLWGRREGRDDAVQAARQGIYLGGVVLALFVSAEEWAGGGTPSAVAAVLASVGATLASGGWKGPAVAATAGSAIAAALVTGTLSGLAVLAPLALVVGARFGARTCWRGLVAGSALAAGVALVAASVVELGGSALGAVAVALLAVGRFEPRFAVAATTAWVGVLLGAAASPPSGTAVLALVTAALALSGHLSRWALRRSFSV